MNKGTDRALELFHDIEYQARKRQNNSIHPVARFIVALVFIVTTISFGKQQLIPLLGMLVYLIIISFWEKIPVISMLKRVKIIIFMLLLIGIANPIFDRAKVITIGTLVITRGMISMITLILKGIFTVCATYILMAEIGISGICGAMRVLKVPGIMVTVIMLIYRYLIVLLQEIKNTSIAYSLRAPGQKGIHIKSWGSFVGQILLRSMDRAQDIYESMLLRGYNGDFRFERERYHKNTSACKSLLYAFSWCALIISFRCLPILNWIGEIL